MRICCLAAVVIGCGAPPAAVHPDVRAKLSPCHVDGVDEPVLCGSHRVWENRATRAGRQIELRIVLLPALGPRPAPDPLVAFAGGPGDFATNAAADWAGQRALRQDRDVLLIDQRGTGASHRLDCKVPQDPEDVQAYFEPSLPPAEVERCRRELEKTADLTQYTTSIAADDVDEVRGWLGYGQVNVFGASYGTRAALVYMRRHPQHVRASLLVGVTGMDQYLPLFHARDGKRALDKLFAQCAAEPACAAAYPDLAGEHARVLDALDQARGRATIVRPEDKRSFDITIPRDIFAEQIRFALYSPQIAAAVPYLVHRAAQGDYAPFAQLVMLWEPDFRRILAYGMHLSVTCTEDVPFITPDAVTRAIAGTYLRGYRVNQQIEACKRWPRGAAPADLHAPLVSGIPTLLVSGDLDPVTPPSWAEATARSLSNHLHVLIPNAHHGAGGLSHHACYQTLADRFLATASVAGLDTSCVSTMAPPPFITDDAGFAALVQPPH